MVDEAEKVTIDSIAEKEATDKKEFNDAFNEHAEAKGATPIGDLSDDDIKSDDDKPAASEKPDGVDEDKPAAKKPDGDKPDADDDKPAEENAFEGWPQEAIDRYKSQLDQNTQLKHRLNSDSGRVSAFQKQINGLKEEIKSIKESGGDQPSQKEISDAMAGDSQDWEKFSKDYPEIAEAIDKRFDKQSGDIATTMAPVIEKQQNDAVVAAKATQEKAYGEVSKDFPAWQTEVAKQEYRDWEATQSPGIRALADSDDVKDASTLIGLYDNYRVSLGFPTMKSDPDPDPGVKKQADELAKRRERQLADGSTLPSKNARVVPDSEAGSDFEQAFNVFAARKDAKRN